MIYSTNNLLIFTNYIHIYLTEKKSIEIYEYNIFVINIKLIYDIIYIYIKTKNTLEDDFLMVILL